MVIDNTSPGVKNVKQFFNDLKAEFDRAASEENEIILDFNSVKSIDLSIAQVLVAASRAAKKMNIAIKLKSVSEDVKEQMQLCGIRI